MFAQPAETAELWHRRMGHRNYRSLAHMQRLGLLHGCGLTPAEFVQAGTTSCESCIKARTHREAHTTAAEKTTVLLHRLIVDMKGPLVTSNCGCKYVVTVTDQASGNCAVGPIKNKSDAAKFVISVIVSATLTPVQCRLPLTRLADVLGTSKYINSKRVSVCSVHAYVVALLHCIACVNCCIAFITCCIC